MKGQTLDTVDIIAIQNLLHRYCDYLDRGNFEAMAALFADADVYLPGVDCWYRSDPQGLATSYREWVRIYPDGTPRTRHVTSNLILEGDGPGRAKAQSYIMVFQSTAEFPLQPIIGGRNIDRFAKIEGAWRFSARTIESDMFGNVNSHLLRDFGVTEHDALNDDAWIL
jgi:3-phenylpropionate/cinnamic acid dioxygenase small subunit